jgi:hypothetical protein
VAGKALGDGGLRPSKDASICCELEPTESIRGCARENEERKDWREEMRASHCIVIDDKRRLYCGAPACNLRSLAASLVQKKGETGKEEEVVYIGLASSKFKQAVMGIEEGREELL